jgi:SNF family Na+-dependent transporter
MTLFLIYIVSLILCHLIVKDGAKTTGKIVVYTAIGPFLIFFILVAYGFSLDGAIDGLKYIFEPDWSKLWNS